MRGSCDRLAFSMVELLVAATVCLLIAAAMYGIQSRQMQVSVDDQKTAAHFSALGRFFEAFRRDSAMARRIEGTADGCRLLVLKAGAEREILYSRKENAIERVQDGERQVFHIPPPGNPLATFVFRIKERSQ